MEHRFNYVFSYFSPAFHLSSEINVIVRLFGSLYMRSQIMKYLWVLVFFAFQCTSSNISIFTLLYDFSVLLPSYSVRNMHFAFKVFMFTCSQTQKRKNRSEKYIYHKHCVDTCKQIGDGKNLENSKHVKTFCAAFQMRCTRIFRKLYDSYTWCGIFSVYLLRDRT